MGTNDENLEAFYRSGVDITPAEVSTPENDEDYSTLKSVLKILEKNLRDLSKDFNAFELREDGGLTIKEQIAVRQGVHSLLEPIQLQVQTAVEEVNLRRKRA